MKHFLSLNNREVEITHPERILFPRDGVTKAELVAYYVACADYLLPHMKNHLLTMHRFPDGITKEGFYQKNVAEYFPSWIKTVPVRKSEGDIVNYVVCNNQATLAYLANQACITPHLWLSRYDKLRVPDRMIFDLDPSGNHFDFNQVRYAAQNLRALLEQELGLISFVMTTGSRGLHVFVPLQRKYDFDVVHEFAHDISRIMCARYPEHLTLKLQKNQREDKIFMDFLRNSYSATAVAPYAVRAKSGAPVATPLHWAEVDNSKLHSQQYNLYSVQQRLATMGDAWFEVPKIACSLAKARTILDRLKKDSI